MTIDFDLLNEFKTRTERAELLAFQWEHDARVVRQQLVAARARTLEEAIQICKARLPMYDLGQCNAVRECISSIEAAKQPLREPPAPAVGDRWLNADSGIVREWDGMTWVEAKP